MSKENVAIVGAGIGGIAAARYLRSQGFSVALFEAHDELGGQWNRRNPNSGIWPRMRTNTARIVTKLSDVQYPGTVAIFPRNGEVLDMVNAVVDRHGLRDAIRFGASVTGLSQSVHGYELDWEQGGTSHSDRFDRVVIATGRFNRPSIPPIEGLARFSGECGVIHSFHYKEPETYRNKRVIVCGGSISALEIAGDLAMAGTRRVYLAQRRQRYVLPKIAAGTPVEYLVFTREDGIAQTTKPRDVLLARAKDLLLKYGGDPARYGAPPPHEDVAKAGSTNSQHFLGLVAEDRIDVRPWIAALDGVRATFTDGSTVEADAIIACTGFDLNLPFLSKQIRETVNCSCKGLNLADFTFHPDLPGLAFIGLWAQRGSYPVVLEQQARYVAYTWGGAVPAPTRTDLDRGVAECIAQDHHGSYRQQHEMALRFAVLAGTDPGGVEDPELRDILSKSAVTGEMFRITGMDALPDAAALLRRDFWLHAPPEVKAEIARRHGRAVGP